MPELPEVETTRRGIEPHILDRSPQHIVIRNSRLRWPIPTDFSALFTNHTLTSVDRRGKYLILRNTANRYALIHLGMSGSLRISQSNTPIQKHDHWDMRFSDRCVLRYNDPRRFGALLCGEGDPREHPLLSKLGAEPLSDEFDGDYLFQISRRRTCPIKQFIMDSQILVGVGNIYAAESLFEAGIHPKRAANRVSRERYQALASTIKSVLQRAIECGGSTLRDYVNGKGQPGYFQQTLKVYGRSGLACILCQAPLREVRIAQRASCYCSHCQR